jgi:L-2-aminoadipate reductase
MAVNGETNQLDWWAERLKDLTVSPLTRDYPEVTSEQVPRRPIEAVESLNASPKTNEALQSLSKS